jgi:hypothetical protein
MFAAAAYWQCIVNCCCTICAAQTVNSSSLRWGTINLMAYFYMVLS